MKTNRITIAILAVAITFTACRKNEAVDKVEISKVAKRELTKEEEVLKLKLEKSAAIIAEVIKDKTILAELGGQLAKKLSITKNDEALTFKQLFGQNNSKTIESTSNTANLKTFTMDANVSNHFKAKYLEIAYNKSYPNHEKYISLESRSNIKTEVYNDYTEELFDIGGGEVYFPYSENFINNQQNLNPALIFTVTSHPVDNDAENEGIVWNDITQNWDYVLVDDNYAWTQPTLIVTINESNNINSAYQSNNAPPSTQGNIGRQVFIGELMSTEQYGELFTGGPDFRFKIFLPGSLTAPFSVDNDFKQIRDGVQTLSCKLTRRNVRKQQWVSFNYIAHSNWVPNHEKIHIGLFEDDSPNWFANEVIKFNPKVKYDKLEVSLFELEIKGNGNDYIGEYDQDRDSFFANNNGGQFPITTRSTPGGNFRIYKSGAVNWTMPVANF
jgi:hypothetical protein